jgi:hypothetical protein
MASLLEQSAKVRWLEGLRLSTLKPDGHGVLQRSVIPYVHRRMRVVILLFVVLV